MYLNFSNHQKIRVGMNNGGRVRAGILYIGLKILKNMNGSLFKLFWF